MLEDFIIATLEEMGTMLDSSIKDWYNVCLQTDPMFKDFGPDPDFKRWDAAVMNLINHGKLGVRGYDDEMTLFLTTWTAKPKLLLNESRVEIS